jgi:hypothetical protein
MKLLFFADREHLRRYGRPIFYDRYIKERMGPVPSLTYGIISSYNDKEQDDFKEEVKEFLQWVEIEEKDVGHPCPMMQFRKKREFDPDVFSKSELKVLREVFTKFKEATAEEISKHSHELPEYRLAFVYGPISYEDMAGDMADYVRFWEEEREVFLVLKKELPMAKIIDFEDLQFKKTVQRTFELMEICKECPHFGVPDKVCKACPHMREYLSHSSLSKEEIDFFFNI